VSVIKLIFLKTGRLFVGVAGVVIAVQLNFVQEVRGRHMSKMRLLLQLLVVSQ